MDFRKVTAIFRPERLEAVEERLRMLSVPGVSVTKVKGFGEYANFYESDWMCTHVRVEVFIGAHKAEEIAEAIMEAAHTGVEGDGIVAVLPVESVYHIRTNVLDELGSMGIDAGFEHTPFREVTCFSPDGTPREFRSEKPLFYLVRRGGEAGCLDTSLKQQALDAGVEIRFGETLHRLPRGGIVTQGPRRADAIAAGYLFETDMADAAYAVVSDQLAPKGYAYLLVCKGRATLASCLFDDFHNERRYLERCVEFFTEKVGVSMKNPRRFGGGGNFSLPRTARKGNILYAGESAGFQDPLFGFGIRWAVISGAEAGRALADNDPARYEKVWKQRLRAYHQTSATNRWFYERLGDRGYAAAMRNFQEGRDVRNWLQSAYAPGLWKRAWYHLVSSRRYKPLLQVHEDCDCTWCRCKRHMQTA